MGHEICTRQSDFEISYQSTVILCALNFHKFLVGVT